MVRAYCHMIIQARQPSGWIAGATEGLRRRGREAFERRELRERRSLERELERTRESERQPRLSPPRSCLAKTPLKRGSLSGEI
jgi:hypothetical protein